MSSGTCVVVLEQRFDGVDSSLMKVSRSWMSICRSRCIWCFLVVLQVVVGMCIRCIVCGLERLEGR
jgi:hypothetical protein